MILFMHRIILSALVVSIKNIEDDYYDNVFYSEIGGMSVSELNSIEFEFLILLDFYLFVKEKELLKYTKSLKTLVKISFS